MKRSQYILLLPLIGVLVTANLEAQEDRPALSTDRNMSQGKPCLATEIVGKDVKNAAGEEIGEIADAIVSKIDGRITHAVFSAGGVLGIGEKNFAVPWSAFRHQKAMKEGDDDSVVLDIPKDRLETAPSFSSGSWPDLNNAAWSDEIDRFYNARRPEGAQRSAGCRLSELLEATVRNRGNESIGEIENLVGDSARGQITHVIVEGNDRSAFNDKYIAIPWNALNVDSKQKTFALKSPSEDVLRNAPTFTKENWPNFADRSYTARLNSHFGVTDQGLRGDIEREGGLPVGARDPASEAESGDRIRTGQKPITGERRDPEGDPSRTGREMTEAERMRELELERQRTAGGRDPATGRDPTTGVNRTGRDPITGRDPATGTGREPATGRDPATGHETGPDLTGREMSGRDATGRPVTGRDATTRQTDLDRETAGAGRPLFQASRIIGIPARSARGEDLGRIQDLVIDPMTGQALYVVVDLGSPQGQLRAIPWSLWRHTGNTFNVDLNRDRLTSAPTFTQDDIQNLSRPEWRTRLEQHYGVTSPATDRTRQNPDDVNRDRMGETERMRIEREKMENERKKTERNDEMGR